MNDKKTIAAIIGLVASIIGIFTFLTGIQNISDLSAENRKSNNSNDSTFNSSLADGIVVENGFATSTIYYVKDGVRTKLFDSSFGGFTETAVSPDKKRVVAVQNSAIYVSNSDGSNFRLLQLYFGGETAFNREFKNLSFISSDSIRLYLDVDDFLTLENFELRGPGTYDLTFDEFNYLVSVDQYR